MDVVVIKHNKLGNYKNLISKLNNLRQQCKFSKIYYNTPIKKLNLNVTFYICYLKIHDKHLQFNENDVNFFDKVEIVAHLKVIDNTNYKFSPSPLTKKIKTPIINKEFLEIYDICVRYPYRNKKIITNLLKQMITNTYDKNNPTYKKKYWISVDVNNIYFTQAIKSFLNSGFGNPQLKNYLLNGEIVDYHFIELTSNNDSMSDDDEKLKRDLNLKICENLKNYINLVKSHTCKVNLKLSIDLTNMLYEYLNIDVEVAGAFQKYEHKSDYIQTIELLFSDKNKVYGDNFTVLVPTNSDFSFHVHPISAYDDLNVFIGWPSSLDMSAVIDYYVNHNLKCHLVICKEGIYYMRLTVEFQYFLHSLVQSNSAFNYIFPLIKQNVINIFAEKEHLRSENYSKSNFLKYDECFELTEYEKKVIYERWKYLSNSIRIKDVFDNKKYSKIIPLQAYFDIINPLNFTLFDINFIKWSDISKADGANILTEYISDKCNIVATELNNYIEMLTS